jgi:nicotinamide-nucleotide amidase
MVVTETLSRGLPRQLDHDIARVLRVVCAKGLRLATAESCTGGLLASVLTDVEGCSHAFDCGFVVYSDSAKSCMLGVPAHLLDCEGAVSKAAAIAMAEGALDRSDADIAVALTGFAGPAGPDGEEGLVHFAAATKGRRTLHRECHFGKLGRGAIRIECLVEALGMIELLAGAGARK